MVRKKKPKRVLEFSWVLRRRGLEIRIVNGVPKLIYNRGTHLKALARRFAHPERPARGGY